MDETIQSWIEYVLERRKVIVDYIIREYQITGRYPSKPEIAYLFDVSIEFAKSCIKRARENRP